MGNSPHKLDVDEITILSAGSSQYLPYLSHYYENFLLSDDQQNFEFIKDILVHSIEL